MPTYSARLCAVHISGSSPGLYTSPAGIVTVVRDLEVYNSSGTAIPGLVLDLEGPGLAGILAWVLNVPAQGSAQWQGRSVMNPGDAFGAVVAGTIGCSIVVSGYQLTSL